MEKLSFANLAEFDGGALAKTVDESLHEIYRDLLARDNTKVAREINIKLKMQPHIEPTSGGGLNEVILSYEVTHKIPGKGRATVIYNKPKRGGLCYRSDTRSRDFLPNQESLGFDEGEEKDSDE